MVSIYMSFFTLSMTSSSFLFLQHSHYIIFNEQKKRRSRGIYDPNLIHVMICTLLYTFVNIPRQWANALIFSISPRIAVITFLIELGLHLFYSHFYVRKFSNNMAFPSGTVTAFTNFISVCGPFDRIGILNLFSNVLLATKVIILYPLAYLEAEQQSITIGPDEHPDRIRCWNKTTWFLRVIYWHKRTLGVLVEQQQQFSLVETFHQKCVQRVPYQFCLISQKWSYDSSQILENI